ncbi:hypothetical protein [Nisaea sp.]
MQLVYSIMHGAPGGAVSMASDPGKGVAVTIIIPIMAPENMNRDTAVEF